jgi:hypothetical protein
MDGHRQRRSKRRGREEDKQGALSVPRSPAGGGVSVATLKRRRRAKRDGGGGGGGGGH